MRLSTFNFYDNSDKINAEVLEVERMAFLDSLFNIDRKRLSELEKKSILVENLVEKMASASDEELKNNTFLFKERLANGETLDDILPEAFATVREAAKRVIGEFPYHVQVLGGIALHQGDIAEMKTGEGKTLTSIMPVYLNALANKGVHVVTVNEYLAQRDAKWMGQIHEFLGLNIGVNLRTLTPASKRKAYQCDVTYTTNAELGFDYLRDNMVITSDERVMRSLNFALVDEVDSILIDESRTPLIISGGERKTANLYLQSDSFVKRLRENEDYEIDIKSKQVSLNEEGIRKAERNFRIENLYSIEHTNLVHHINQALRANYIMMCDVEYVVSDSKEIIIVDQFTGRLMPGRSYSDGLHQAIEAKENVKIKQETSTLATITYQNFFRLYNKLAGMTGTAKTEEEEFIKIYNMRVIEIPTNRPIIRDDAADAVYGTQKAKYEALVEDVYQRNQKGQPVLVGTISVETSELVAKMLTRRGIRHFILNAKNHAREAEIIANAGKRKSVTIATNMAGRGTDIKIDAEVVGLGGLAVLGSERHESRRIDNQLRGRSGRQGDPGYSQFYISMQDELMVRFGGSKIEGLFSSLGDTKIESSMITKSISSAQKRVEGSNFDIRKTLLEYDDVLRQQREIIYDQRNEIINNEDVHDIIHNMFNSYFAGVVSKYAPSQKKNDYDFTELLDFLGKFGVDIEVIKTNEIVEFSTQEVSDRIVELTWQLYENKITRFKDEILPLEKRILLTIIDRMWVDHIDIMSKLRNGIGLRSYASNNPLQMYVQEGYELFNEMMDKISLEMVQYCFRLQIISK